MFRTPPLSIAGFPPRKSSLTSASPPTKPEATIKPAATFAGQGNLPLPGANSSNGSTMQHRINQDLMKFLARSIEDKLLSRSTTLDGESPANPSVVAFGRQDTAFSSSTTLDKIATLEKEDRSLSDQLNKVTAKLSNLEEKELAEQLNKKNEENAKNPKFFSEKEAVPKKTSSHVSTKFLNLFRRAPKTRVSTPPVLDKHNGSLPTTESNPISTLALSRFRRPPEDVLTDFYTQLKSICNEGSSIQKRQEMRTWIEQKDLKKMQLHLPDGPIRGMPNAARSIIDFADKCPEVYECAAFRDAFKMVTGNDWAAGKKLPKPHSDFNPAEKIRKFLEGVSTQEGDSINTQITTALVQAIDVAEAKNKELHAFVLKHREEMEQAVKDKPYKPY
jgi:hypothetical protein